MKRAFTLIEIVIVISILLILTGLAIPSILRSRNDANEGAAMANLKILSDACQLYHLNLNIYPQNLAAMALPVSNPPYIDQVLAGGRKQGYIFIYNRTNNGFTLNANPEALGRYYYIDETGVLRVNATQQAGAGDAANQ
ncbi:MAG: prepilin-type N-terminal cleavage/methylation domain-containing protein [Candidatus Omnitrophica bacterium]|nr:prepilin-type N-terminal cleavage/methylation domain-containing protein [Candidatus Omnitrophota bacterium]